MATIKCDICGGSLSMDASGDFALCDSCGMRHTKDRVKSMAQEVTGTVEVSNLAGVESLMKRGYLALEDSKWEEANDYFGKVLDIDAEYAPAYIGKLCVNLKLKNENELTTQVRSFNDNPDYIKAIRFANSDYKAKVEAYSVMTLENNTKARQELVTSREQFAKYSGCISTSGEHVVGLKSNGTVVAVGNNDAGQCNVSNWRNIVAVAAGGYSGIIGKEFSLGDDIRSTRLYDGHTVGLRADGTVIATGGIVSKGYKQSEKSTKGKCYVSSWRDIIAIAAGEDHTVGLKSDGTVVAALGLKDGYDDYFYNGQCAVSNWRNIVTIAAGKKHTFGLTSSGKIVCAGNYFTVPNWSEIVAIAVCVNRYSDTDKLIGVKADGTVVSTDSEKNDNRSCWKNIVSDGGGCYGLVADGTVAGIDSLNEDTTELRDIVAVTDNICVMSNGSVITLGYCRYDGNVARWKNIGPVSEETKQKWEAEAKRQREEERKRLAEQKRQEEEEKQRQQRQEEKRRREEQQIQWRKQGQCVYCGGQLGGLFIKKCKSCGEEL